MGFFMLFYMPSWAAVYCVDPGGGGTHTDLQSALDAAKTNSEDDTIKVVRGLYNGNFTYSTSKGDSLTLEGGYDSGCGCREIDPESTVLQGAGSGSVLYIFDNSGGSITVDGFTLKNGGGGSTDYGGALRLQSEASTCPAGDITIRNNIIEKNVALASGGGIYAASSTGSNNYDAGNITLINNIITGNRANANYGGGIFAELYASNASIGTITLLNNTIHGNKAQYGGGAYLYTFGSGNSGAIKVYNNIVTGNTSVYGGADIRLSMQSGEAYGYHNNYHSMSGSSWDYYDANIDTDPIFVSTGSWDENGTPDISDDVWTEGNYHLKGNSPCVDTGDNSAPGLPALDFEGNDRIIDGNKDGNAVVDMGADEYKNVNNMPAIPLLLLN